ncbi:MAG TPA: PIG-L family deacetylase [Bacillota bacterium]|nr:PIG-L family deacetylase [Bacillota bacterium]
MLLHNQGAEIYIPDGREVEEALTKTTILAISAHQDDIEIMAYDGILKCFGNDHDWFTGVVVTNGSGSPRDGIYAAYTDPEMQRVRKVEQKKAAFVGEYAAQVLLDYSSAAVKDPQNQEIVKDIQQIIQTTSPKVIYTHNLADKHETHVATGLRVIQALRELAPEYRPERIYGCEVWRDLDWLPDEAKVIFDLSAHENIAMALMGVFDSQICGGKRYDLAIMGRRRAAATFSSSHGTDTATALGYAMDLTPLIRDESLDIKEYVLTYIHEFAQGVAAKIEAFSIK